MTECGMLGPHPLCWWSGLSRHSAFLKLQTTRQDCFTLLHSNHRQACISQQPRAGLHFNSNQGQVCISQQPRASCISTAAKGKSAFPLQPRASLHFTATKGRSATKGKSEPNLSKCSHTWYRIRGQFREDISKMGIHRYLC